MAASTKKAKPKGKSKPTPKPVKASAKTTKVRPAKSAKVSLSAKKTVKSPALVKKVAVKSAKPKPAAKPGKDETKKAPVKAKVKTKTTPLPKPKPIKAKAPKLAPVAKKATKPAPVAKKAKPVKPAPKAVKKTNAPASRKLTNSITPPVTSKAAKSSKLETVAPSPVAANAAPVKPQVVIHKPHRQILPPPPPPPAPKPEMRKPVTATALRAFELAVKAFNRRQFEDAKAMFEQLQEKFPHEVELLSRAQMYVQVCQQKLTAAPTAPVRNVSADELFDRGVWALNIGDFAQARNFFEKALRLNPNEPHFLYSLAATYAQTGPHEQALDYLRRSIQIQPRFRSQAFDDADFSGLRENRQFQELLGLTSPFDLLEARR